MGVSSGNRKGSVTNCGGDISEHRMTETLSSGGAETTSQDRGHRPLWSPSLCA